MALFSVNDSLHQSIAMKTDYNIAIQMGSNPSSSKVHAFGSKNINSIGNVPPEDTGEALNRDFARITDLEGG